MRGVFDIVGPVMIGPSSSHTAGAARLGRMALRILGEPPTEAVIELHGSFAKTYRGHGTDKALVAGLLGMAADDERLRDALTMAAGRLKVTFVTKDLGDVHPNTAAINLSGVSGRKLRVVGASVGGGNIVITEIDGYAVELTGEYYTLITVHRDKPGVIALVTHVLAQEGVNIAFMRVSRQERGAQALMILEADQPIPEHALAAVRHVPAVQTAILVPPV
ncbi:L-serine ammonia-lyase, iron-sulfur-dependent subunit beta [Sporolituus thermophilus]|uniref:L-serine deaminase n=1 Tax=Sporolituus thermophilus DSM 23256 TaxID=1123285 RepID=A0A1G7KEI5_9FIRM|nr:L-serine ammonia-lyase, iron-sulfur-dependent subunit beta [Sporolituus thermophilus]SDF35668.1 L-serine dehydratase [Sporolituus thermophilus DSM 23256]